jgi:tRNA (guanine10-N2)-methyltransferase
MLLTSAGSRRLITYRRIPDAEVDPEAMKAREEAKPVGKTADELNPFRKAYFNGFESADKGPEHPS